MKNNISEEELEFYHKHPELISAIGSKKTIYWSVLISVFVTGFVLVAISKGIKFSYVDAVNAGLVEFVVDLIFELGVALWGGVATTVLLQNFVQHQYKEGRQYQQQILRELSQRSVKKMNDKLKQ